MIYYTKRDNGPESGRERQPAEPALDREPRLDPDPLLESDPVEEPKPGMSMSRWQDARQKPREGQPGHDTPTEDEEPAPPGDAPGKGDRPFPDVVIH